MPVTKDDIPNLVGLALRTRKETPNAGPWDQHGTYVIFEREFVGQSWNIVLDRVLRHSSDPEAKNPAAIKRRFEPMRPEERAAVVREEDRKLGRRQSPRRSEECRTHPGEWPPPNCRPCATEDRAVEYEGARDSEPTVAPTSSGRAAWDEMRAAIKGGQVSNEEGVTA